VESKIEGKSYEILTYRTDEYFIFSRIIQGRGGDLGGKGPTLKGKWRGAIREGVKVAWPRDKKRVKSHE